MTQVSEPLHPLVHVDEDLEQKSVLSSVLGIDRQLMARMQCHGTGTLRSSWGRDLAGVTSLNLSDTDFIGQLPAQWSHQMTRLEVLRFNSGNVNGPIPAAWAAPGAFPNLRHLEIRSALQGHLPGGHQHA